MAKALSILVHETVSLNLFNGIKLSYSELMVSHLQYENDTITFCEFDLD